jgi:hypothetical protein
MLEKLPKEVFLQVLEEVEAHVLTFVAHEAYEYRYQIG